MAKTIREASQDLNLHINTIRRAIGKGDLLAQRVGRGKGWIYLIEQEELDKFRHGYYHQNPNKGRVMIKGNGDTNGKGLVRAEGKGNGGEVTALKDTIELLRERLGIQDTQIAKLTEILALPPKRDEVTAGVGQEVRAEVEREVKAEGRKWTIAGLASLTVILAGLVWFFLSFIK